MLHKHIGIYLIFAFRKRTEDFDIDSREGSLIWYFMILRKDLRIIFGILRMFQIMEWWMTVFTVDIFLPFIERERVQHDAIKNANVALLLRLLKHILIARRHFVLYVQLYMKFSSFISIGASFLSNAKELAKTHLRPIRYAAMMILAWLLQNWIFTSLIYFPFRVKAHRLCIACDLKAPVTLEIRLAKTLLSVWSM